LRRLSELAFQQLAQLIGSAEDAAARPGAALHLAQTGHLLYRQLFQLDRSGSQEGTTAQEVRDWLNGLTRQNAVERLEIVGDAFALPWIAVYDQAPNSAAFGESTEGEAWQ